MYRKILAAIVCLIMALSLLAGCQSQSSNAATTDGTGSASAGQITAINGDQITLALGTLSEPAKPNAQGSAGSGNGSKSDGSGQQALPSDDGSQGNSSGSPSVSGAPGNGSDAAGNNPPSGSDSSGNSGNPPSGMPSGAPSSSDGNMPSGGGSSGGFRGMGSFTASGEEMTITVTDDTVITLSGRGQEETGSLSDLAVDDIITFTLSGNAAATITVEQTGGMGGGPKGDGSDNSSAGSDTQNSTENSADAEVTSTPVAS